jgi:hypothetical protein
MSSVFKQGPFRNPPYQPTTCPAPPYNAPQNTNYATNAQRNPSFPLNTGSDFNQIIRGQMNNTIFQNINQKNQAIKDANTATGAVQPYLMFKSNQERIAYLQAQVQAQSRVQAMNYGTATGNPPAFQTPTTCQICNSVFSIINNGPCCDCST